MKSTGLGGYLSLINSHSPKTHQNFSFSDTEKCANATSGSNEASTSSAASEDSSDEQADQEQSQSQNHNHLSKSKKLVTALRVEVDLGYRPKSRPVFLVH